MFKGRVKVETAIVVTKYAVAPLACWPLSLDASTSDIVLRNIYWGFAMMNLIIPSISSFYKIFLNLEDLELIVRVSVEIITMASVFMKMLICKIEEKRLQKLMGDMQAFLKTATKEELSLIQTYVDRSIHFHTVILISAALGSTVYCFGPLFTSQPLPGDTAYPFSIEPFWIWASLYASQVLIIFQAGCTCAYDLMFAILLWYGAARFEMLSIELGRATSTNEINPCIRIHQEILEYVDRLKATVRVVALAVTSVAVLAVTTGCFVILRTSSWFILAKFVLFEIVAAMELFLITWPADHLTEMSESVAYAAYTCRWIGKPREMAQQVSIVMQRSQQSVQIAIRGLLPSLSLEFYGSMMSLSFSYITTLRAVLRED